MYFQYLIFFKIGKMESKEGMFPKLKNMKLKTI